MASPLVVDRLQRPRPRYHRPVAFLLLVCVSVAASWWWFSDDRAGPPVRQMTERTVVLGFDGVEPTLVEQYLDAGLLPNLAELRRQGAYSRLRTACPAQSPTCWASFAVGGNAGVHGVFDFVRLDRNSPYQPSPESFVRLLEGQFLWDLIPIRRPRVESLRQGLDFWTACSQQGVRSVILSAAVMFPASPNPHTKALSGLGVPDIRGTQATYTLLTTNPEEPAAEDSEFGGKWLLLEPDQEHGFTAEVPGPQHLIRRQKLAELRVERNQLRQDIESGRVPAKLNQTRLERYSRQIAALEQEVDVRLPIRVRRMPSGVEIKVQGTRQLVDHHAWSPWFRLQFPVGSFITLYGIARFFVLETEPHLRLYMTPIDFDPERPVVPLCHPAGYSRELAKAVGLYKTRGWAAETAGLKEGALTDEAFLDDLAEIMDQRAAMTLYALDRPEEWNLLVSIFYSTDRVAHMFWRAIDPAHPAYSPELASRHGRAILHFYQKMDDIVGRVRAKLGQDTTLMVLSDHGFASFRRGVNLNTWLEQNGFLMLSRQARNEALHTRHTLKDFFRKGDFFTFLDARGRRRWLVDWPNTQAFALGLGGIYINLKGRQAEGAVEPSEYEAVRETIRARLCELTDQDGSPVVSRVYLGEEVWRGPAYPEEITVREGPDLTVGFEPGYRASWQSCLGGFSEHVIENNAEKWSGDHCSIDHEKVPGILFTNRPLVVDNPSIEDIAATVLDTLRLEKPPAIGGRPILETATRVEKEGPDD